jgi:hypothetical protein
LDLVSRRGARPSVPGNGVDGSGKRVAHDVARVVGLLIALSWFAAAMRARYGE